MSNKLAQVSLLLWLVTLALFLWFIFRGTIVEDMDDRTVIVLQPKEHQLIIAEMRTLLAAIQGILEGTSQGNMTLVIKSARSAGMAGTVHASPALMAKLPIEFKSMGMSVHHEMDQIARFVEQGLPTAELLKMTASTLSKCITCHDTWQVKVSI